IQLLKKLLLAFIVKLIDAHFFNIRLFCPIVDKEAITPVIDNRKKTLPASSIVSILEMIILTNSANIAPIILNKNIAFTLNINHSFYLFD
ncbi:TPA: hypothetical protein ACJG4Y_001490, partial [Salmonella enterica subsp. enterica serovar Mgulani]